MQPRKILSLAACLTSLLAVTCVARASPTMSAQEMEAWFNSNGAAEVNEGALKFLTIAPAKPVHHHQNLVRITPGSLASGWTELKQCHDNLDAVPEAQITFRQGYIRNLRVLEARAIGKAWAKGHTVQMKDVAPGARLCIKAQTRALNNSGSGYFTLNNGPYMRKFLDGYYPMRVSIQISYPPALLRVVDVSPAEQPGFHIGQQTGLISVETIFEGELRTQIQFERRLR